MEQLFSARDAIWTWGVPFVLVIAALVLTIKLRAPQLLRIGEGFRGALAHDPRAEGTMAPGTAVLLAAAATYGSAAAVSAATAVAFGGAGALAWLWLFGLLIAPLRYAETLLARTSPPGKAGDDARGSLATRLSHDASPVLRALGAALVVLVPLAGFAYVGGAHGGAAMEAADRLLPGSAQPVGIAVAIVAALLVLPALAKPTPAASSALGWLALAALLMVFGVALVAVLHDAGRGFGGIGRALDDAFSGAENVGAFSGALVGEIAGVALVHVLAPLAATTGVDGAIHGAARAPTARGQAAAAMFGPLLHVVLATVLGLSFVATGAFHRRTEDVRTLDEVTFWRSGFETVSQRLEPDRGYDGTLRIVDGTVLARPLELGTERGMITRPRFTNPDGSAGDFALRVRGGRVVAYLVPQENGTLEQAPLAGIADIRVEGNMLPRGAALLTSSMVRAGGDPASRISLVALLLLAAIGAAAWGVAASRSVPRNVAMGVAFLPALGLLLAATGVAPWLAPMGACIAGVLVVVAAVGITIKARELATIASSTTSPRKHG